MTRRQDYAITRGDPERLTIVLREETVAEPELRPLVLGTRALVWTIDLPGGAAVYSTASGQIEYIDPYGIYWVTLPSAVTSEIARVYAVPYAIRIEDGGIHQTICTGYISEGLSMARGGRHGGAPGVDLHLEAGDLGALARVFEGRVANERDRAAAAEAGLADRIAAIERVAVADLAITPALAEVGLSPVPVLTWRLDGPAAVASLTVNGTPVSVSATSWTAPAPVTADTQYSVAVTDPLGRVDTATVGIVFQHRVWWGVSDAAALTAADVLALAGTALTGSRARSVTLAAAGQYLYYAYPRRYGAVSTATIYGFSVDIVASEISITTPAGNTEIYCLLRSPYPLTDSNITMEVS